MKKLYKRILGVALSLATAFVAFPSWEATSPVLAEESAWDNVVTFDSEEMVNDSFGAYFASTQNARREDVLNYSWKIVDGAIARTNNVDPSKDTQNIAILTYMQDTFNDFELSVDFQGGAKTSYWPVVAIRQQIPGKYYLTPGGGAGIFMQQNGKITAWGPIVNSGMIIEQPISNASNYYSLMWHNLRIVAQGSSIEVYVDGNLELTTSVGTTDYIKGYVSLISVNNDCKFDNFKIRSLASATVAGNEENKSEWANDGTPLDDYLA